MRSQHYSIQGLCFVLLCLSFGCTSERQDTRGHRVPVDGIVTLDGDHLAAGRIVFITNQGAGEVKATAAIVQGYYKFDLSNGPLAGKARVEIYPEEMELEQFEAVRETTPGQRATFTTVKIPSRYNLKSQLTADVRSDAESNLFLFDLVSK